MCAKNILKHTEESWKSVYGPIMIDILKKKHQDLLLRVLERIYGVFQTSMVNLRYSQPTWKCRTGSYPPSQNGVEYAVKEPTKDMKGMVYSFECFFVWLFSHSRS